MFRQVAAHLLHEANTEQTFSLGGHITDPNMNPDYLAKLTSIASNMVVYKPSAKAIFSLYRKKYSKQNEAEEEIVDELLQLMAGERDGMADESDITE